MDSTNLLEQLLAQPDGQSDTEWENIDPEFIAACRGFLAAEKLTQVAVEAMLGVLEAACAAEINSMNHTILLRKKLVFQNVGHPWKKDAFSELLWCYAGRYQQLCNTYYPCVASLLAHYIQEQLKSEAEVSTSRQEKKRRFLACAVARLRARTFEEKHMCFISEPVLDILEELIQTETEAPAVAGTAALALQKLRDLAKPVQDFCLVGISLGRMFEHLAVMVGLAAKLGANKLAGLFEALQVFQRREQAAGASQNAVLLAFLLSSRIQKKALTFFSGVHLYMDPGSPKLSGTLCVKTQDCTCLETSEYIMADQDVNALVLEIIKHMFYPSIQLTSATIEIGEQTVPISARTWNLFHRVFRTEITRCRVKFMNIDPAACSQMIEGFFASAISRDVFQLTLSPVLILSEKNLQLIAKLPKLNSASLCEPFSTEEGSSPAIESFFLWMEEHSGSFFATLKSLSLSLLYSSKTFAVLSQLRFTAVQDVELEFLKGSAYLNPSAAAPHLAVLVNSRVFPVLKEISIHNNAVSRHDFNHFAHDLRLVQNRYRMLYCPLGSSYLPLQTHSTFRKPEPLSLNSGLLFIINEDVAYKWAAAPHRYISEECILCKRKYIPGSLADVLIMPCGNLFHLDCVSQLLLLRKNMCCPLCKKKIHMYKGLAVAVDILFNIKDQTVDAPALLRATQDTDLFPLLFTKHQPAPS